MYLGKATYYSYVYHMIGVPSSYASALTVSLCSFVDKQEEFMAKLCFRPLPSLEPVTNHCQSGQGVKRTQHKVEGGKAGERFSQKRRNPLAMEKGNGCHTSWAPLGARSAGTALSMNKFNTLRTLSVLRISKKQALDNYHNFLLVCFICLSRFLLDISWRSVDFSFP